MRSRLVSLVMVVLLAAMAACAEDTPDEAALKPATEETATEESVADEQPVAVTELDVVYGTWEGRPLQLRVFEPAQTDGAPAVIHLGGSGGGRGDVDAGLAEGRQLSNRSTSPP
jgi:hypothetical protein